MTRNNLTLSHLSITQMKKTMTYISVMFATAMMSTTTMAELSVQQGTYSSGSAGWSSADAGRLLDDDLPAGEVKVEISRTAKSVEPSIVLNNASVENRYPASGMVSSTTTTITQSPSSAHTITPSVTSAYNYNQPTVNARAALVMDAQTGEVLFGKNTNSVLPIASITKLMTAVITADAGLDMSEKIILQQGDFSCSGCKSSSSTLRVGDSMNRAEALLFALMKSENPAASALARTYPGGRSAFYAAMNAKARSLGMNSTRYLESTGLHPGNVSSARDLGILVSTASQYGLIRQFSTTPNYNFNLGQRVLSSNNTNALVRNGGWNINISKTGYINEAGRCVVMHTTLNNRPVAVILLGASTSEARTNDATRLMNWVVQLPKRI